MLSSVVADNLHPEPSRLYLAIMSILDWFRDWRRRIVIQPPAFGQTSSWLVVCVMGCMFLLRRGSDTAAGPSEQTHAGISVRVYRWTISGSGLPRYVLGEIVRISEGMAQTQVTVGIRCGIIRARRRIIEVGRLDLVSACTKRCSISG